MGGAWLPRCGFLSLAGGEHPRDVADAASSSTETFASPGGIEKNDARLVQTLDADKRDPGALLLRHFCWSRAQVYAAYGMPDVRAGSAGASEWTYLTSDQRTAVHFGFVDGRVDNVHAAGR
jgi:hypothetical protein